MAVRTEEDDPKEEIECYLIVRLADSYDGEMGDANEYRHVSTYTLTRTLLHIDVK